ncbi:MAG: hypothetical protein ACKO97_12955 [Actinomycetota bacterium]|nr:DUF1634 domain-containing protein [Actinomycetota bacterium]MBM3815659.1 hypothetical protein [Actinomycetota bacterium]
MTLARWNSTAIVLACLAAIVGVVVRGDIGIAFDVAALLLLGTLPMLRVVVLAVSWARAGDRRYAFAASAVLAVMMIGTVFVSVWR